MKYHHMEKVIHIARFREEKRKMREKEDRTIEKGDPGVRGPERWDGRDQLPCSGLGARQRDLF